MSGVRPRPWGSLTFGLQAGPVTRIVKGAQIRLIDQNGADVADGEIGGF